jgi:hypothetical protein
MIFSIRGSSQATPAKLEVRSNSIHVKTDTLASANIRLCCCNHNAPPLFLLNGNVIGGAAIAGISPNVIVSINVYKNAFAIKEYGDKAKNGVVNITVKQEVIDDMIKSGLLKPIL